MEIFACKQMHILYMVKIFLLLISLLIISLICFRNLEYGLRYVLLLVIIAMIIIEIISFYTYLPIEKKLDDNGNCYKKNVHDKKSINNPTTLHKDIHSRNDKNYSSYIKYEKVDDNH